MNSLAEWEENKVILHNKIPEFYGFLSIHYKYKGTLFIQEQQDIFNSGPHSITNDMSIFLINLLLRDNRTSDLAFKFNIW